MFLVPLFDNAKKAEVAEAAEAAEAAKATEEEGWVKGEPEERVGGSLASATVPAGPDGEIVITHQARPPTEQARLARLREHNTACPGYHVDVGTIKAEAQHPPAGPFNSSHLAWGGIHRYKSEVHVAFITVSRLNNFLDGEEEDDHCELTKNPTMKPWKKANEASRYTEVAEYYCTDGTGNNAPTTAEGEYKRRMQQEPGAAGNTTTKRSTQQICKVRKSQIDPGLTPLGFSA